jgi:hypothetical protein
MAMSEHRTIRRKLPTGLYFDTTEPHFRMRLGQPKALEISRRDGTVVIRVEYKDIALESTISADEILQLRD